MDSNVDLSADAGPMLRRLCISMTIISTLSLALRIWSRIIATQTRFWWDDWLAVCAWGCAVACSILFFMGIDLGVGKHISAIHPVSNVYVFLRYFYVSQIVFDSGIAFAKFSVLLFYIRIFTTRTRRSNICIGTTAGLAAVFILYKLPGQIFSCVPPRKNWEPSIPGHCNGDLTNFDIYIAGLVLDVVIDLMILLIPVPMVSGLQMKKARKAFVLIAFACGYATWITSIGRMVAVIKTKPHLKSPDVSWHQVAVLAWSEAEISISVISICIPSWFYLIKRVSQHGVSSLFTTNDLSLSPARVIRGGPQPATGNDGFTQLRNQSSTSTAAVREPTYPAGVVKAGRSKASGSPAMSISSTDQEAIELGSVGVRREIYVDHSGPV